MEAVSSLGGVGSYLSAEHPILLAHRGSMLLWPENTLVAFQGAVDAGARYLETDVRLTADGEVVTFHDPVMDRVTNGTGSVAQWRYDDLRRLDAAHHFGEGTPLRGRGIYVPTLEEAMTVLPDTRWNIDVKSDDVVYPLARLIARRHWQDRVLVASFSARRLRRLRHLTRGGVASSSGMLETAAMLAASRIGLALRTPADVFQVPEAYRGVTVVDGDFVAAVDTAGALSPTSNPARAVATSDKLATIQTDHDFTLLCMTYSLYSC